MFPALAGVMPVVPVVPEALRLMVGVTSSGELTSTPEKAMQVTCVLVVPVKDQGPLFDPLWYRQKISPRPLVPDAELILVQPVGAVVVPDVARSIFKAIRMSPV
jgi:hypothetical protein